MARLRWLINSGAAIACGLSVTVLSIRNAHARPDHDVSSNYLNLNRDFGFWDDNWDLRKSSNSSSKSTSKSKSVPDSTQTVPSDSTDGRKQAISDLSDNRLKKIAEDEAKSPRHRPSRHLILVRHGQYIKIPESEDDAERKLTDLGRVQALATAKRLAVLLPSVDRMVVSTMCRAVETAGVITDQLDDVGKESCQLLCEGAPYPPEPPSKNWTPEKWHFHQDGPRIEAAFRKYFHRPEATQEKDSYEVIVCHANVIRYFVCRALQFPPEGWLRMSLGNCSITWVTIRPNGRVSLKSLGDTGHLPPSLITFN